MASWWDCGSCLGRKTSRAHWFSKSRWMETRDAVDVQHLPPPPFAESIMSQSVNGFWIHWENESWGGQQVCLFISFISFESSCLLKEERKSSVLTFSLWGVPAATSTAALPPPARPAAPSAPCVWMRVRSACARKMTFFPRSEWCFSSWIHWEAHRLDRQQL